MENSRKVLSAVDRKHAEIRHRWIFTRACHYGRVRGLEVQVCTCMHAYMHALASG